MVSSCFPRSCRVPSRREERDSFLRFLLASTPHLRSSSQSSPHLWGWGSREGVSPAYVAGPHSPKSIPIIQDKNEPPFHHEDNETRGALEHSSTLRRRGTGSVSGGGKGEKERQWSSSVWSLGNCLAAYVAEKPPLYKCFSFISWTGWGAGGQPISTCPS